MSHAKADRIGKIHQIPLYDLILFLLETFEAVLKHHIKVCFEKFGRLFDEDVKALCGN